MAKNNIRDWDTTASNNTDIAGIGILGSNAVSNFDGALRTAMAQIAAVDEGNEPVNDTWTFCDPADSTKRVRIDSGNVAAGQTRVLSMPNANVSISAFAATLLDDADTAAARLTLGATGNLFRVTAITASGTHNLHANAKLMVAELIGGGGGGGSASSASSTARAGGGGAGGGYSMIMVANPSASYVATIGAGGAGGAAGDNNGTTGGTTTFAGASAAGGGGGSSSGTSTNPAVTGTTAGGTGSGGSLNFRGSPGSPGFKIETAARCGGAGGDTLYGAGGRANSSNSSTASAAGNDGLQYGGGGSGALSSTTVSGAGGNGADGLIVVWEYV